MTLAEQLRELLPLIGMRMLAFGIGVRSIATVSSWAAGEETTAPTPGQVERAEQLHRVATVLGEQYGPGAIQMWLTGMNPDLQNRVPVEVIRDGEGVEAIGAAHAFLD